MEDTAHKSGPSKIAGLSAFGIVAAVYAVGFFTMSAPMMVEPIIVEEEEPVTDTTTARRYVKFPVGLTASIPKFDSTVLIEVGLAVHDDLPESVTDLMATDPGPMTAPLSEALRSAAEDPMVITMNDLQTALPPYLRDAMNEALFTEELPEPVFEVLILKLVSAPY